MGHVWVRHFQRKLEASSKRLKINVKNTTHIKLFRFSKMSFNQLILQTIDSNNYVKTSAGFIFNIMQFLKSLEKFHHQAIIILNTVSLGVKVILDILVTPPVSVSQLKQIIVYLEYLSHES